MMVLRKTKCTTIQETMNAIQLAIAATDACLVQLKVCKMTAALQVIDEDPNDVAPSVRIYTIAGVANLRHSVARWSCNRSTRKLTEKLKNLERL
ncbi:hypothetical protein TNCV_1974091 [Trichonephila clavipes]|nr:hypothetical protein TNCV_1974091 [Trichonephila clavipes]